MFAVSGLASIFRWGSICRCHIAFRQGWKYHAHSLDELLFKSQAGVLVSWIGLRIKCLILVAHLWTGFAPVGYRETRSSDRTRDFFEDYLAAPVMTTFYVVFKVWGRNIDATRNDIDVISGRRALDLDEILPEEPAERATWSWWKKAWKLFG